jgi:DNA repair protein RadD
MKHVCDCGFEFPIAERESETKAHEGAIMSTEVAPVEMTVDRVRYAAHMGKSGVPTLRVDYFTGLRIISEYVCLEHSGYARTKAINWWGARSENPFETVPATVDYALTLADALRQPTKIEVSFATKFPEIKRFIWDVEMATT